MKAKAVIAGNEAGGPCPWSLFDGIARGLPRPQTRRPLESKRRYPAPTTAFADSENEALLYRAIRSLIQNKTVIMIAHRLSTIVRANKIIVIDKGKILEEGTHDSLLHAGGLYSELYAAYTKSTEWTVSEGVK